MLATRCLAAMVLVVVCSSDAMAKSTRLQGTMRQRAEQLCYNDATRLCNEFVPDEAKITTCMTAKKAQLSPGCRKVFDEGGK